MKWALTLIVSLLCSVSTIKATERFITLRIDTLIGYEEGMYNGLVFSPLDDSINVQIDSTNGIVSVLVQGITSGGIYLKLDNKYGALSFDSLWLFQDNEIRISKWTIYQNGLNDTFFFEKGTYWKINDSLSRTPIKVEKRKSVTRNKGTTSLPSINTVINGMHYTIPIEISCNGEIFHGHGYSSRRRYNNYLNDTKGKKIHKLKRFHIYTHNMKCSFYGRLILK